MRILSQWTKCQRQTEASGALLLHRPAGLSKGHSQGQLLRKILPKHVLHLDNLSLENTGLVSKYHLTYKKD